MTKTNKTQEKPVWLKLSEEELKKIITDLAETNSPAKIGLILRDQYGVPTTKLYGKKLSSYLKEMGKYNEKEELENITKKLDRLQEHIKSNSQDKRSKHKLQKAKSCVEVKKKYFQ